MPFINSESGTEKINKVHLVLVLDLSSSMSHLKTALENYVNELLDSYRNHKGEVKVTLVEFSDSHKIKIYDSKLLNTLGKYQANIGGMTALYKAIHNAVFKTPFNERFTKDPDEHGFFIIFTDGQDNDSDSFTQHSAKNALEFIQSEGWEVIWNSSNVDITKVSTNYGIPQQYVVNLSHTERGLSQATKAVQAYTTSKVSGKSTPEALKDFMKVIKDSDSLNQ